MTHPFAFSTTSTLLNNFVDEEVYDLTSEDMDAIESSLDMAEYSYFFRSCAIQQELRFE